MNSAVTQSSFAVKPSSRTGVQRGEKPTLASKASRPAAIKKGSVVSVKCEQREQPHTVQMSRRALLAAAPLLAGVSNTQRAQAAFLSDPYCNEELYYTRTRKLLNAMEGLVGGTSPDIAGDLAFFREESVAWLEDYKLSHLSKTTGRYVLGYDNTLKAATGITGTANWCEGADDCVVKPFDADHTLYNKSYMLKLIGECQKSVSKGFELIGKEG
mmetsp:Transcript_40532/g.49157  ORF Transcript_40532/g.49157 Transcript_40532/m.49157 type:complete len:214 (-) Transcript_40532:95-736(-)|eukprot:CAMPEP_0197863866 /NCGR_PEP_ID=MMETSP1438-20131217/41628_1 /TAXON_ID=1461541 /ORGANISM="Pterosperma sp., Strain CCMP1384" /LENGTH=213 /DNA_ID=CAMNT_0043481911 /DNA_START=76 /DNA_END=717 /DNA_ORIENTATION=-